MLVAAEPVDIDDGIGRFAYIDEQPRSGVFEHIEGTDTVAAVKQSRRANYSYGQVLDLCGHYAAVAKSRERFIRAICKRFSCSRRRKNWSTWSRGLLSRLPLD